jgi:hypothetical protein
MEMTTADLQFEEREAFRAATDTGLWDVLIASVMAMFAIAPLLSGTLGDFWSSAIFVPIWAGLYFGIRFARERFVVPRVGDARWGTYRKSRLKQLSVAMLVVNIVALVLSAIAFFAAERGIDGFWVFPLPFGLLVLLLFSLLAYAVSIPRFFLYGISLALGLLLGEFLFRQGLVTHHGFPVVYGTVAITIAVIGIVKFVRIVSSQPADVDRAQ